MEVENGTRMFYDSVMFSGVEYHKSITLAYRTDKLAHLELVDASNVVGLSEPPMSVTIKLTKKDVEVLAEHVNKLLSKFD